MKTHSCDKGSAQSKLVIHRDSQRISKQKPKIRIIHIVAPEIIKTDVENFRELVQRLTGKPLGKSTGNMKGGRIVSSLQNTCGEKETESAVLRKGENPNTLLMNLLGDVEGFMHGINGFSLLPFTQT